MKYDCSIDDLLFVALSRSLGACGITADDRLVRAVQRDFPQVVFLQDWK